MGTFRIDGQVLSVQQSDRALAVTGMLVESGSELTWIPAAILTGAGVRVVKEDVPFVMANGREITRAIGYAIVRVGGFETVDEVVFGLAGDLCLLGARTLEGFGAAVDLRRRRLVSAGPHPAAAA